MILHISNAKTAPVSRYRRLPGSTWYRSNGTTPVSTGLKYLVPFKVPGTWYRDGPNTVTKASKTQDYKMKKRFQKLMELNSRKVKAIKAAKRCTQIRSLMKTLQESEKPKYRKCMVMCFLNCVKKWLQSTFATFRPI